MAKPNNNQQHPKQHQGQKALEEKRARNHSPAIERKRAENAWHTNPLAPIPPKVLRRQAMELMRTLYKPGFAQLSNEEKRVNSISEKRKADNSYYLNWLTKQSELLGAHEESARAQVLAAGQQAQGEVQKGWEDLHQQMVSNAGSEAGVSTLPAEAAAFNVSDAALKGAHEIQDQRTATQNQLSTLGNAASLGSAINFAEIAAMESKRNSDQQKSLNTINNSRQELRLNRAAEAAKEYARGLDKEIEKAQARAQIAASEATAAIEAKRFGLDAEKAAREGKEFEFEKHYKNKKLGLEKFSQKQKHEIEEGNLTVAEAEEENKRKHVENEGNRTPAEKAKSHEKQQAKNQQINANINTVLTQVQHNPKLQKMAENNYQNFESVLHNKYGYNPLAIAAAAQLYLHGELTPALKEKLRSVGYNGKYVK